MLPLTPIPGSTYRFLYSGALGVSGVGVQQSWDLSVLPRGVREDLTFYDNFRIFVRQVDSRVTALDPNVTFSSAAGTPEEINLAFDCTDEAALVEIEFWYVHSVVR